MLLQTGHGLHRLPELADTYRLFKKQLFSKVERSGLAPREGKGPDKDWVKDAMQ
jgi:hypothetical protein